MKPNFFIAGAAKSGTTSLDRYLNQHPEIFMASRKETHYFAAPDMPDRFQGPGDEPFTNNVIRKEREYEAMFAGAETFKAVGESSVYYLYYPRAAERMKQAVPNAKIILVLRDPVERAYSAYMHLMRDGREFLDFEQSLSKELERQQKDYQPLWFYQDVGRYAEQVKHFFAVFGRENVLVIEHEEFNQNSEEILRDVFAFLSVATDVTIDTSIRYNATGVPTGLYQIATKSNMITQFLKPLIPQGIRTKLRFKAKNMSLKKEPMSPELKRQLRSAYAGDIRALEGLLGRNLPNWQ